MTFRQFAFKNVTRNKRLYAAYFLSSLFSVMVFFTFSVFANHPSLSGNDFNTSVTTGMNTAAGIIYVFSFFYILYSMSSFLQSRKKEFGLLVMQGMSMKQIRLMVFLENMCIGFLATLGGILLGLVFAKVILLVAENVLILDNELPFYFPTNAILVTFASFIILFFFISLFVSYVLRSKKLLVLIKGNTISKGEPKANLFLTILAILLLGTGYTVALIVHGLLVVAALIPVVIVVTIGTYLLFTQLNVFVIRRLRRNDKIFWHKTNMLLFSDLAFRMKDNARTFFMVAMVATVAFSAIGTLFGFQTLLTEGTRITNPNTFTLNLSEQEGAEQKVQIIQDTLRAENIEANMENMLLRYFEVGQRQMIIASESDFNRFAALIGEDNLDVQDGQTLVAEFDGVSMGLSEELVQESISLTNGTTLTPQEVIQSRALPAVDFFYIVSDHDYELLPSPKREYLYYAWQATDGEENSVAASKKLVEKLAPYEFTSGHYKVYQVSKAFGAILFIGLFIGIVFFVSAGSFLYFRLYMDLDEDKQKFKSIAKLGLTFQEMNKVLSRQTMILFFAPILVALIHGAVALTALSNMFYYSLVEESVSVLSVFLLIQIVYFFIVRFFYTKQIRKEMM